MRLVAPDKTIDAALPDAGHGRLLREKLELVEVVIKRVHPRGLRGFVVEKAHDAADTLFLAKKFGLTLFVPDSAAVTIIPVADNVSQYATQSLYDQFTTLIHHIVVGTDLI